MTDLPQIVGKKCSACQKAIGSIADGSYCSSCLNPLHHRCRRTGNSATDPEKCETCGSDPNSAVALQTRAELEENEKQAEERLVCPQCGNTHGFSQYGNQMETEQGGVRIMLLPFFLIAAFIQTIAALGKATAWTEYECLRCHTVFRPARHPNLIGLVFATVSIVGVIGGIVYLIYRNATNSVP